MLKLNKIFVIIIAVFFVYSTSGAQARERAIADIKCKPSHTKLSYHCNLILKYKASGKPIAGAKILIKADMPSMPMAHNLPLVPAQPANLSGHYKAELKLEMYGEWALTIDISHPFRDRLIKKLNFGNKPHKNYGATEGQKIQKHQGHGHSNHTKH